MRTKRWRVLTTRKEKLIKNFTFNKIEYLVTKIKKRKKTKTVIAKKLTKTKEYRKKQKKLKEKNADKTVEISLKEVMIDWLGVKEGLNFIVERIFVE